jgi:two-component system phosphate regulon sensor histidine kinase PhoR
MDVFFVLVIIGLLIFFIRRYLYYRNYVKHLGDSLKAKQSFLLEGETVVVGSKHMLRLTKKINALISENTQLQQGRSKHVDQLEAMLGNMYEGVVILDASSRVLMANKALKRSFKNWIGGREIIGQRLDLLFASSRLTTIINEINSGKSKEPAELELIQAEDRRWLSVSGATMRSKSRDATNLTLLIFYDITYQKELETIRKEFVANVSHELRTPVTIIKGYADTLIQDIDKMPEEQKLTFLNKLAKNVDRLHELLEALLSLSQIESTNPGASWKSVSINELIRQVLETHSDPFEAHGIQLELELSSDEIEIEADPSRLLQVFENLFLNVLKYTPVNSKLTVGTQLKKNKLHAWVGDNGPGIPAEDLSRIFERFYRVEKGRSRGKGGTGLGLSIVKRIISLHRGKVVAENVERGGLRISFFIPTNFDS